MRRAEVRRLTLLAVPTHALLSVLRRYLLLMMVLQGSHTDLATPLHSHWISVWSGSSVWLAGVGSARLRLLLLLLRIRAVCHAVKLGALHGHGVHRCHLGSVVSLAVISRAHGRVVSLLCPPAVACGAVRGAHVFAEPHARLLLSRGITIVILIAAVITAHHRARRGQKLV